MMHPRHCRKIAVLKFIVLPLQPKRRNEAHFTSSEKASSVPGRMHTAIVESSGAANPRVPVLKLILLCPNRACHSPPPPDYWRGSEGQLSNPFRCRRHP